MSAARMRRLAVHARDQVRTGVYSADGLDCAAGLPPVPRACLHVLDCALLPPGEEAGWWWERSGSGAIGVGPEGQCLCAPARAQTVRRAPADAGDMRASTHISPSCPPT